MFFFRCEWLASAIALSCCIAIPGCGASAGERCMEQDDCASDLICCKQAPGLATPGMCESVCEDRRVEPDSSTPESDSGSATDASVTPDAADDAEVTPDAADDAAPGDGGEPD